MSGARKRRAGPRKSTLPWMLKKISLTVRSSVISGACIIPQCETLDGAEGYARIPERRDQAMKQSVGRCLLVLALLYPSSGLAGVSRDIQARYVEEYENKAMFLKIPIRGLRQIVYVNDDGIQLDRASAGFPLAFRVGEQVRIVDVQFRDELIRFKFSAIDLSREGELIFRFFSPLPN